MFTRNKASENSVCDPRFRELIRQAAAATLQQLGTSTANMSLSELRGYVRSKAQRIVRDLEPAVIPTDSVMHQVVHLVIEELSSGPTAIIPLPHVQRRAA